MGEQQNTKISNLNLYLLNTDIIEYYVVARGGIEPPTHGFSVHTFILSPINLVICRADLLVCNKLCNGQAPHPVPYCSFFLPFFGGGWVGVF